MFAFKNTFPKPFLIANSAYSNVCEIDLTKRYDINIIQLASRFEILEKQVQCKKGCLGYGGYLERRWIYGDTKNFEGDDGRNIHLGIDLWFKAETPIHAPLDGVVHSFANNKCEGDYGYCIILKHEFNGEVIHTLYGHLSAYKFTQLYIGKSIKAGTPFCHIGAFPVNGNWPPHLHFQIIKDMQGHYGDYPGVCKSSELGFYRDNCPDPTPLLGLKRN